MSREIDELLAFALASGQTREEAGRNVGVSLATIERRMSSPEFRDRVRELSRQCIQAAAGKFAASMLDATEQLHLIATDGTTQANRLRASVALLELGLKFSAYADLEERVKRLEGAEN